MTGFTKMIVDGSGCVFPPLRGSELWKYTREYYDETLYEKLEDIGYQGNEIDQMMRILKRNECLKYKENK